MRKWLTVLCVRPMKQSSTERQISHLLLPDVDSQMQIHFLSICNYDPGPVATSTNIPSYKKKKKNHPHNTLESCLVTALLLCCQPYHLCVAK